MSNTRSLFLHITLLTHHHDNDIPYIGMERVVDPVQSCSHQESIARLHPADNQGLPTYIATHLFVCPPTKLPTPRHFITSITKRPNGDMYLMELGIYCVLHNVLQNGGGVLWGISRVFYSCETLIFLALVHHNI